jgi:hypothetical protein
MNQCELYQDTIGSSAMKLVLDGEPFKLLLLTGFWHKKTKKPVANQYFTNCMNKFLQITLLAALGGLYACETAPPVQEMSDARQAIAVAKEAGAAEHAAFHLKAAEDYLASAETNLGERAYNQARRDAKQAKMKALDALKASEKPEDPR